MDEFKQSDIEKETNDSQNTFFQNVMHYKERENVFIKIFLRVVNFLLHLL